MRYSWCLLIALIFAGCENCSHLDCLPGGARFYFIVIDKDGHDLVFDKKVPVDSLDIHTTTGDKLYLIDESINDFIISYLYPDTQTYQLNYKGQSTEFTATTNQTGKSRCCGTSYGLVDVSTTTGKLPTKASKITTDTFYVVQLK